MSPMFFAANHYIRSDAIGTNGGSGWENAWTNLPKPFDNFFKLVNTYYFFRLGLKKALLLEKEKNKII